MNHSPDEWIAQIFSARAAQGGVVRRSIAWVDREIGRERFIAEVRRRGFHLLASSNQFIVVLTRPRSCAVLTRTDFRRKSEVREFSTKARARSFDEDRV